MDIENFLASAHDYAETTKRTYRNVIPEILGQVENPASLSAAELIEIIKKSGWGNARQCVALAACKKYLAWKYREHPAQYAKIKRIRGKVLRALSEKQVLQILASFDPFKPKGARDLAIASLMLDTGLRASEICNLTQADTDTSNQTLQVIVKGGQWEAAVFSAETAARIEHWKRHREQIGGITHLFVNINTGKKLSPEGLRKIVISWGKTIEIPNLTTHDFRRTFACLSTTITNTPERILMEGGRWKSPQMIYRYTRTIRLDAMRKHLIIPALDSAENRKA